MLPASPPDCGIPPPATGPQPIFGESAAAGPRRLCGRGIPLREVPVIQAICALREARAPFKNGPIYLFVLRLVFLVLRGQTYRNAEREKRWGIDGEEMERWITELVKGERGGER